MPLEEINSDASPVLGDPNSTIPKAQQIRRVALAAPDPSPQGPSYSTREESPKNTLKEESPASSLQTKRTIDLCIYLLSPFSPFPFSLSFLLGRAYL